MEKWTKNSDWVGSLETIRETFNIKWIHSPTIIEILWISPTFVYFSVN